MARHRLLALALPLLLGAAVPMNAQIPDQFENLRVLPKEISKSDLVPMMRGFSDALGVRCNHCHVGPDNLQGMDFASDEKPEKVAAREMMKMVAKINGELLADLKTSRSTRVKVECMTCHHGVPVPIRIESIVADTIASGGVEAAKSRYLELKAEHYGSAAYDFGTGPINQVVEDLARAEKLDAALAMAQFGVEQNPGEVWSLVLLGSIHAQRDEKPQAIAVFEQVLEKDPENRQAKRMLERLKPAAE